MDFTDDTPVNAKELATAMRVGRSTVFNWKTQGYQFEFGIRTTPGHCKDWLRERVRTGQSGSVDETRRKLALSRLA
jgi:hypothetical protein